MRDKLHLREPHVLGCINHGVGNAVMSTVLTKQCKDELGNAGTPWIKRNLAYDKSTVRKRP